MCLIGGVKMTKYYYDDPLAAQWMNSKFGMNFQELVSVMRGEKFSDEMMDIFSVHCVDFIPSMGRYYIHPKSLHLLEPQDGDVVKVDSLGVRVWGSFTEEISQDIGGKITLIYSRNGMPFHWPKCDEE